MLLGFCESQNRATPRVSAGAISAVQVSRRTASLRISLVEHFAIPKMPRAALLISG
jgi:hypothetical protein